MILIINPKRLATKSLIKGKVKQIVALAGILILGALLLIALSGFIPAFLGAVIFYVICSPFVHFLMEKGKLKKGFAVSLALILSFLVILIPVFGLTYSLIYKVSTILSSSHDLYSKLHELNNYVHVNYGVNILSPDNLVTIQSRITNFIPNLFGETIGILIDIAIMYFILFFLLHTEISIEKSVIRFLPYKKENAQLFAKELINQTYSNVIGSPLLSLIQAAFASFGFWVFGLHQPVFWGLMCGFLSYIPFVGSALIWLPAGVMMAANGFYWQGMAILIYGLVIIVNVDNVFRLVLQKKIGNVHPVVTVFGVIIGLKWFGIPGVIFGPLLISYLLIMIKIYNAEYTDHEASLSESVFDEEPSVEDIPENKKS